MIAKDFKDLRVYQMAFDSAMKIFELTKKFPNEERYSLSDQIRRSSRSICANIAEAWRKRKCQAAFVLKLSDSDAESAETGVWLDFALHCGYLDKTVYQTLLDNYDHICRQLTKMIPQAETWCEKSIKSRTN